ncbi:MAG: tol-pal system protein YbgF [Gammaproteobacteria bacterium]|nr:tol-pal system protein YbgF [Gammaproteobacteria bacterium]
MKHSRLTIINILVLAVLSQVVSAAPKATKEELNIVTQRLERLERALDSEAASSANKESLITLQQKLNNMQRELQELRGQNESLRNELDQLQKQQRESFMAIDKRMQMNAQSNKPDQQMPVKSTGSAVNVEVVKSEPKAIERKPIVVPSATEDSNETIDAYRNAFLLLKQRRHEESITAFEDFLSNYPNSKYSANAQYWLAEANYVTKRYERALTEFQTVIDRYPTSSKLPDARLKIGYTQYELGQFEESRVTLTRLRAQFPNSTVAGLAQERLERLEKEGH